MFRKLLLPVDFGDCTDAALALAPRLAAEGAELVLLHVIDPQVLEPFAGLLDIGRYRAGTRERLQELAGGLEIRGGTVRLEIREGPPVRGILEFLEEDEPGVIVIGSHGRKGLRRLLLGSVAEQILRQSKRAVCVVKLDSSAEGAEDGRAMGQFEKIAFASDFESDCELARDCFLDLLKNTGAAGSLLHVFDASFHQGFTLLPDFVDASAAMQESVQSSRDAAHDRLDKELASLRKSGLRVESALLEGAAWEEILAHVSREQSDLLVLGTHLHQGLDRFLLGSVAEKCVRLSEQPVLVVPPRPQPE